MKYTVVIVPSSTRTRVLVSQGPDELLRAILPPPSSVHHERAAIALLQGLSLWLDAKLYAKTQRKSASTLTRDPIGSLHELIGKDSFRRGSGAEQQQRPPRVRAPDVEALHEVSKVGRDKIEALLVALPRLSPEERAVVADFLAKARAKTPLTKDESDRLRLIASALDSNADDIAEALDRAKRAAEALPEGWTASPLSRNTAIVDSNVVIALEKEDDDRNATEKALAAAITSESDVRVPDMVATGEPSSERAAKPISNWAQLGLSGIEVNRDSEEYRQVFDVLTRYGVGQAKGGADRAIVTDLFFASRFKGVTPRFLTGDDGIIRGMLRVAGSTEASKPPGLFHDAFPSGFIVTVFGRSIQIVPLPQRLESNANED